EFLSIDNKGVLVSLSPRLAAQCGYSLTVDFLGNAKFLASVLSCFAQNTNDETYKLTVQISVFSNSAMTSASSYVQSMTCRYSPWAEREILCERNYMEVSVRRGVPLIEPNFVQDDPDWSLAYPELSSAGSVRTECQGSVMMMMLEKSFVGKYFRINVIDTVPKARVFNVTLGTFLPDVELVKIIVGPETLTVPEANLKGYNVQEHVFPNGSKTYTLQVPFEDPNVKQKVTPPDTRTYILPLTYLLNIVPENTPFTHPAVVEAILKDIIPPTVTGYCDGAAFYTMVIYGNMGRNWIPFVGSRELGGSQLALYKYNANSTNFWMTVPYNSADATYEVISSSGIRSRLDLTLKDIGTMVVVADFSLSCSFPTKMIDCFTNGTMAALAVKVESVPSLSPSQLTLRDPSCRPLQSDAINAVFYFNVNSCGTTRRVSIDTFKTIEEVQHIDKLVTTPLDQSGEPW
ncbi:UNVERIFIED_CONTAM: hypothetical protein FKN15_077309, partial [Acipenser sinensis]